MQVQFVCRGNLYRGRLAEAYLRSKQIPGLVVTSSGTEANEHMHTVGPISWEALRLIKNAKLVPFMKLLPEKTTEQALARAEAVIFLDRENYEAVRTRFPHLKLNYHIWDIPDIELPNYRPSISDDTTCMEISERTFAQIKQKVDEFVEKVLSPLLDSHQKVGSSLNTLDQSI